jgi:hypothetical protein
MASLIRSTGQSLRTSICRSCRCTFSTSQSRLQDEPVTTTPAATPTSAAEATPKPVDFMTQLLARSQELQIASATRSSNRQNPAQNLLSAFKLDPKKLTPGYSRSPDTARLADTARTVQYRQQQEEGLEEAKLNADLRRRLGRHWKTGDVYAPQDLGPREQKKWLKRQLVQNTSDVFELIGKKPIEFYRVSFAFCCDED